MRLSMKKTFHLSTSNLIFLTKNWYLGNLIYIGRYIRNFYSLFYFNLHIIIIIYLYVTLWISDTLSFLEERAYEFLISWSIRKFDYFRVTQHLLENRFLNVVIYHSFQIGTNKDYFQLKNVHIIFEKNYIFQRFKNYDAKKIA